MILLKELLKGVQISIIPKREIPKGELRNGSRGRGDRDA